jgi:hypothetical protein
VAAPPPPPFAPGRAVVSHAAHPDGHTIFVSTRDAADYDTYSFDAERGDWTWRGAWALPFRGQGHFDRELGAWFGLDEEPGYVRACQVPSRSTAAGAGQDGGETVSWRGVRERGRLGGHARVHGRQQVLSRGERALRG